MRFIFASIITALATTIAAAQTQPVPPDKVPQPDGTIQLVPKPPAFVYTPYFIDPTIGYRLYLQSGWAQKSWNGGIKNGQYGYKDSIITVDVLAMPLTPPPIVVNGKSVTKWSVYRSTDAIIQYDHTRLELLPLGSNGNAFDAAVMNASKSKYTILGDGLILYHTETLPAPELRTPPQKPQYYQWNFDGYMWQGAYRLLGRLHFRVKDDYYLPAWGQQKSFIRLLPSVTIQGNTITTKVDGSPVIGTNVLKETRSEGEDIIFGVPSTYKVAHYLTAPTTKFKVGDTVSVKIMVKPESKPQLVWSVATNFIWDPTVLEFVGVDKTGAPPSMENGISRPSPTSINESAIPKDGNAFHNWLNQLGNRKYFEGETLIATLNFKVLADFTTTKVELAKQNDPRLVGIVVSEESRPLGSTDFGDIVGTQNGATINGTLVP